MAMMHAMAAFAAGHARARPAARTRLRHRKAPTGHGQNHGQRRYHRLAHPLRPFILRPFAAAANLGALCNGGIAPGLRRGDER
jgi:hypothetical protein